MAGTIIADTWQNGDGTQNYKCRAWVNFNGTGTVAIRASGNVSSITDNGVGNYTVNFTTAMVDTNYTFLTSARRDNNASDPLVFQPFLDDLKTQASLKLRTNVPSATTPDTPELSVAIFR